MVHKTIPLQHYVYGNCTYPWADTMVNWSCVYNGKDYGGSFDLAQKAAVSSGGGVVYYPAGTYSFSTNIMIESMQCGHQR